MVAYINHFFFGIYPYVAIFTCIVGCIIRYDREQYSWQASSSQLISNTSLFRLGNNLFHVGLLLILTGHCVGLLMPESFYIHFISVEKKQLLAMIAGGVFGIICFIGMTILVVRRITNKRVRSNSRFSDILILLMIYAQLILGLMTIFISAQHLNGVSMVALARWAQHIVTFRSGASDFVMNEHILFKLHIFLGLTIFLIFPFTRLVHALSFPLHYFTRTGYQIVRARTKKHKL
ncbi:MAG: respiratory nitrate reductase subunit gamma [Alphaproteobacteria bacterium]